MGVQIMEFDFSAFTLSPSIEAFNRCKKKDLLLIADFFDIAVHKGVTKQVLKEKLFGKLVEASILRLGTLRIVLRFSLKQQCRLKM